MLRRGAQGEEPCHHRKTSVVAALEGVGWVLDPNLHALSDLRVALVPRPAFHLAAPHIQAPYIEAPYIEAIVSPSAPSANAASVKRHKKRRKQWQAHPDATDPHLVRTV